MTIEESRRRYGHPVLTTETPENQLWECEDRVRYHRLRYNSLTARLESGELDDAAFDVFYAKLLDAERMVESYLAEAALLRIGINQKKYMRSMEPKKSHPDATDVETAPR